LLPEHADSEMAAGQEACLLIKIINTSSLETPPSVIKKDGIFPHHNSGFSNASQYNYYKFRDCIVAPLESESTPWEQLALTVGAAADAAIVPCIVIDTKRLVVNIGIAAVIDKYPIAVAASRG